MGNGISIQHLLAEVDRLAGGLDREGLHGLLTGLAKIQPVEERQAFLSCLQQLAAGEVAEDRAETEGRAETLVRLVEEIAEEAAERQGHIENGEYHELDDWEDERDYGYGGWCHDDDEPDALTSDLLDLLKGIRTEADHWFLDGAYGDAAPVYRALIELEGTAREEFNMCPDVCDRSTAEKYGLCMCRLATEAQRCSVLYDAIVFSAVNLRFPSGPFGEQGVVPLATFKDEVADWKPFGKVLRREPLQLAKRLQAELLAMEEGIGAVVGWLREEGARQVPAWLWFLHELEASAQWELLAESANEAVKFMEDNCRIHAAGLLVKAGAALGKTHDVAKGLQIRFFMNPSRRLLAEAVGRLESDPQLLRSELEVYDEFLESRSFDQLHATLKILLGGFDVVRERCTNKPQDLGWSYSAPDPMAVSAGFLLLCGNGQSPPQYIAAFAARYLWRDRYDHWYESPAEGEGAKWNTTLKKHMEGAMAGMVFDDTQKKDLLAWLRVRVSGRANRIVENQHRKSYGKAAEALVAWAEAARLNGLPREAEMLIAEFKQGFPRHRAFQKELDQRAG